jgi:hypothetical protein
VTRDIDRPEQELATATVPYPAIATAEEQRRAFVLDCIGAAASEMDAQAICQMVVDLAEMLRTGAVPGKVHRLRPVP